MDCDLHTLQSRFRYTLTDEPKSLKCLLAQSKCDSKLTKSVYVSNSFTPAYLNAVNVGSSINPKCVTDNSTICWLNHHPFVARKQESRFSHDLRIRYHSNGARALYLLQVSFWTTMKAEPKWLYGNFPIKSHDIWVLRCVCIRVTWEIKRCILLVVKVTDYDLVWRSFLWKQHWLGKTDN